MTSGFSIIRNARLLDYPLEESVRSVIPLCDEFILAVGKSDDDTLGIANALAKTSSLIKVIQTQWDLSNNHGGLELSRQTNTCLQQCRGDWAFYIQADEVFHEKGIGEVKRALELASSRPDIDAIVFDYLHFYGDFRHTISGRSWYRKEARLIKTNRGIHSFRDAQGFRKNGAPVRAFGVSTQIFHYGYVRGPQGLRAKSEQMAHWWKKPPGNDYRLRRHLGIRPFTGKHPNVMENRVRKHPNDFQPKRHPRVWDRREIKDLLTQAWESVVPYRIGEFRNYELVR